MLIAFEGPDQEGAQLAADKLSGGHAIPNATEETYRTAQENALANKGIVQCFTGISWFTHLACALALPKSGQEPQTVFTMPDTHLVFKLNRLKPDASINQVYTNLAHTFMALNESRHYDLFKTITIMESFIDPLDGVKRSEVVEFSSPLRHPWNLPSQARLVHDDLGLFDMLSIEDASL